MSPLVIAWENLASEFLQPLLHMPRHPFQLAGFGWRGLRSASGLARGCFSGEAARALFGGLAAHSFLPLERAPSAAFGLVLGMMGHAVGWPVPEGGSQRVANALAAHLRALGGEIVVNSKIEHLDQLPLARATFLDVTPLQLLLLACNSLPDSYRRRFDSYRYGPGVFQLD